MCARVCVWAAFLPTHGYTGSGHCFLDPHTLSVVILLLCCVVLEKNVAMRGEGEKKDCFTELEFHAFKDDIYNPYQT